MNMKLFKIILILTVFSANNLMSFQKYILPCRGDLLNASKDMAMAQVGTLEKTGHNDGEKIEEYLSSVGLTKGLPYCAAGQYWCFRRACAKLNLTFSNIPIKRTGLANDIFNDASLKCKKTQYKPALHDLIVWRKGRTISGHIERVVEVRNSGWVITVGFNTSSGASGSQNEGQGVFLRRRNIYASLGRMTVRGLIGFQEIRSCDL